MACNRFRAPDIFDGDSDDSEMNSDAETGDIFTGDTDDDMVCNDDTEAADKIAKAWNVFRLDINGPYKEDGRERMEQYKKQNPQLSHAEINKLVRDDYLPQWLEDSAEKLKDII